MKKQGKLKREKNVITVVFYDGNEAGETSSGPRPGSFVRGFQFPPERERETEADENDARHLCEKTHLCKHSERLTRAEKKRFFWARFFAQLPKMSSSGASNKFYFENLGAEK